MKEKTFIHSEYSKAKRPGDLILSVGGGEVFEVLTYPVCRLYEDKTVGFEENGQKKGKFLAYRFQPDLIEYRSNKEPRRLSYWVRCLDGKMPFLITEDGFK